MDELPPSQQQEIQSVCGAADTACIYDYAVSGSQGFAMMTKQTRDGAVKANVAVSKCTNCLWLCAKITYRGVLCTGLSLGYLGYYCFSELSCIYTG